MATEFGETVEGLVELVGDSVEKIIKLLVVFSD